MLVPVIDFNCLSLNFPITSGIILLIGYADHASQNKALIIFRSLTKPFLVIETSAIYLNPISLNVGYLMSVIPASSRLIFSSVSIPQRFASSLNLNDLIIYGWSLTRTRHCHFL